MNLKDSQKQVSSRAFNPSLFFSPLLNVSTGCWVRVISWPEDEVTCLAKRSSMLLVHGCWFPV